MAAVAAYWGGFSDGRVRWRASKSYEEFGYVLEGTFQVTIDGKAAMTLKAGDVFFSAR